MKKEMVTYCKFVDTCYDRFWKVRFKKPDILFDEYETNVAFFHLKNFIQWYKYELLELNELESIDYQFDDENKTIIWTIEDNTNIDFHQILVRINNLINLYHLHDVIEFNNHYLWVLNGKLILKE